MGLPVLWEDETLLNCPHCKKMIPMGYIASYLGRLSKGKTSEKKKKASRENGKLGGRPRK